MNVIWAGADKPDVNQMLGNWCAAHIGLPRPFEQPFTTMGVTDGSSLVAAVVFNNYQPEAGVIELHGAAETARWMPRPVLYQMFAYPFDQLGCQNVVMRVSERNTRLFRILTAYGFESVFVPRLRGRDEGERIFWLTQEAWESNGFHKENVLKKAG